MIVSLLSNIRTERTNSVAGRACKPCSFTSVSSLLIRFISGCDRRNIRKTWVLVSSLRGKGRPPRAKSADKRRGLHAMRLGTPVLGVAAVSASGFQGRSGTVSFSVQEGREGFHRDRQNS